MSDNIKFYNETLKKHITFEEVVSEIINYINSDKNGNYQITVGTDSESGGYTNFVTAIAIIKKGNGGRYFWTKSETIFCPTLRDRIYKETIHSIMFVQELKSRLRDQIGEEFFWDDKITVHLDIGKNGPTRDFIDSMVGMVKGYGFEAIIKPDSFCAFVLADKHT